MTIYVHGLASELDMREKRRWRECLKSQLCGPWEVSMGSQQQSGKMAEKWRGLVCPVGTGFEAELSSFQPGEE